MLLYNTITQCNYMVMDTFNIKICIHSHIGYMRISPIVGYSHVYNTQPMLYNKSYFLIYSGCLSGVG